MDLELLIASLALLFTFYQAYLTRRHNRLSVKPTLVNHIEKRRTPEGTTLILTISNCGIGPAIIGSFEIFIDGKPFGKGQHEPVAAALHELFKDSFPYILFSHSMPSPGFAIKINEDYKVFEFFLEGAKAADDAEIQSRIDRSDIRVEFSSFYGDRDFIDTRK